MIQSHYVTTGFYDDEKVMSANTVANFSRHSFRLMRKQDMLEQRIPVFIVGCGPSLDKDLPYIKKWQDRAVIVSGGSALGVLLKAGITPDIHVELENGPQTVSVLKNLVNAYDLSQVRLMATSTLHPDVASLFLSVWFFSGQWSPVQCFLPGMRCPWRGLFLW